MANFARSFQGKSLLLLLCIGVLSLSRLTLAQDPSRREKASSATSDAQVSFASLKSLAGTWSGQVRQTSPVLQVTVDVTLTAGALSGTISYPALSCSGQLQLVTINPGELTLDQEISTGKQDCDNGVVTLAEQTDGTLTFLFSRPGDPSPTGTLTKQP